ncbi:MAG: TetR/AcrR family transcriptional regulator [Pseudomonadota bacterium]|nr:TetR/AcrR family transcriptional regulator [Pseudomonadota bacterium]
MMGAVRRPRADAERNRARVLEAAHVVFAAGGADASLEAVARQAGVGIGTLYRHFPSREALFDAVYRHEVQRLVELVDMLSAEPPVEALRQWMYANVGFIATKKGMSAALAQVAQAGSELMVVSVERLTEALGRLLDRASASGQISTELAPGDLLRALVGLCYVQESPGWQGRVLRVVDVLIDGLVARR